MSAKTAGEARNEEVIRSLYLLAEGNSKDTSKFVSLLTDDGYFYDVSAGKRYFGPDIGVVVDDYAAAFPDIHRELYSLRGFGDHVLVELSLNGTHKGDLAIPEGTIPPTGKAMHASCCDVFRLKDGRVFSFHCYVAVPILLEHLGCSRTSKRPSDPEAPAMAAAADHADGYQEVKYYLIFLHSIPERSLSPRVVGQHAAHLAELYDSGKLVMAGPLWSGRAD